MPFFAGDKDQAIRLANWTRELGGVSTHDCLLVVDGSTTPDGVIEPLQEAFNSVTVIRPAESPEVGWGNGTTDARAPNEMWLTAAWYVYHKLKCRWLWVEPDAGPTRSSWVDEIVAEDNTAKKPFMGAKVIMPPLEVHMSGIAVYPPDVCNYSLKMMQPGQTAWDYAGREDSVKHAHFTDLIQHVYRTAEGRPTFPTMGSLELIGKRTALFHCCKDSTLIDRLRELRNRPADVSGLELAASVPAQAGNGSLDCSPSLTPPTPPALDEGLAIAFLTERSKRSGIDKGRITRRLAHAGFVMSAKPSKRRKARK